MKNGIQRALEYNEKKSIQEVKKAFQKMRARQSKPRSLNAMWGLGIMLGSAILIIIT